MSIIIKKDLLLITLIAIFIKVKFVIDVVAIIYIFMKKKSLEI